MTKGRFLNSKNIGKMTILEKIRSFEFDKNRTRIFGIKSAIVWGHSKDTNGSFPMLYISKPKNISQEDFEILLDKIDIEIRK
jgi:hypothetical protein